MHCKMCILGEGYMCALVTNIQEHQELCVGQEDSPREEPSPTFKDASLCASSRYTHVGVNTLMSAKI